MNYYPSGAFSESLRHECLTIAAPRWLKGKHSVRSKNILTAFLHLCVHLVHRGRCQVRSRFSRRAASSILSPWRWPRWGWECLCTAPGGCQRESSWSGQTPERSHLFTGSVSAARAVHATCVCERQRKSAEEECVHVCGCVCVVLEGKSKCPRRKMWVSMSHVWSCSLITLRVVCRMSEICTLIQLIIN